MAFLNNVSVMNSGAALSLAASGNTVDTYKGEPGNPSGGIVLDKVVGYAIQAVWTGSTSPNGSLTLQASNDNVNWSTLSGTSVAVSGSAGNTLWKESAPYYKYVRVAYTRTSGGASDTVTCTICKLTRQGL